MENYNNDDIQNKIKLINDYFKLPIYYLDKEILNKTIVDDLELVECKNPQMKPLYHHYFNINDTNYFSIIISKQFSEYYTTNKKYLKDSQNLIKNYKHPDNYNPNIFEKSDIFKIWDEIKNDNGFKERYQFIDWNKFEYLNNSESFLEIMSVYNLVGPIITIITPIIILLIPFMVLKIKQIEINFNEYINVLREIAKTHAIGKLFTMNYSEIDNQQLIYTIISAAFYVFSIYQNILVFIRFNDNMQKIHNYIFKIKEYIKYTIDQIDQYIVNTSDFITYQSFHEKLKNNKNNLLALQNQLVDISEYKITCSKKIFEIGKVMKVFYSIHSNDQLNESLLFSFGFHGYVDCIIGLQKNLRNKLVNYCTFTDKNTGFTNSYYGILKDKPNIKNNIDLSNNIIITGPNASGKTTLLKSSIINIICNQQMGYGFYEQSIQPIYKYLHCYLNIPDTSGRDSLFQAEARRCKEIIDCINENPTDKHFCIFDELYSGTNPVEAVTTATSFLKYLSKNKNVRFHLTTHYIKLCKKVNKFKNIHNYCMETTKNKDKIIYKYKIKQGISTVKGGMQVLCNLNYPKEIIGD